MKKTFQFLLIAVSIFFVASCSPSKNSANLKAANLKYAGTWTVSNISVDVPAGFKVTDVFDEGPAEDFQGSTWKLNSNGKGSFRLNKGVKEDIFWGVYTGNDTTELQFKILKGAKAQDVKEGYILQVKSDANGNFVAKSPVDLDEGKTGYITYTFSK